MCATMVKENLKEKVEELKKYEGWCNSERCGEPCIMIVEDQCVQH